MQVVYNHIFMRLLHLVSLFHPVTQVWVVYPFCMGYGRLAIGNWIWAIGKKEKIGKGSYGVAEPPSKSKWYRFGAEFLRTESYITNF